MQLIFLVDYENVNTIGLEGIEHVSPEDKIVIFYSAISKKSVKFIEGLRKNISMKDITLIETVRNGQNALDFQLSTYLGFNVYQQYVNGSLENTCYYIISKDKGFDCVIDFWTKSSLVPSFYLKRSKSVYYAFHKYDISEENVSELQKIINSINNLSDFHRALIKKFGAEQGLQIYNDNKKNFKVIKNL